MEDQDIYRDPYKLFVHVFGTGMDKLFKSTALR